MKTSAQRIEVLFKPPFVQVEPTRQPEETEVIGVCLKRLNSCASAANVTILSFGSTVVASYRGCHLIGSPQERLIDSPQNQKRWPSNCFTQPSRLALNCRSEYRPVCAGGA